MFQAQIIYIQEGWSVGRSVVGRSSLFIKLMSYTPLRYVRNVAHEEYKKWPAVVYKLQIRPDYKW